MRIKTNGEQVNSIKKTGQLIEVRTNERNISLNPVIKYYADKFNLRKQEMIDKHIMLFIFHI